MKTALIVYGGWEGHYPSETANILRELLEAEYFSVTLRDSLDALESVERLQDYQLIIIHWTQGEITSAQFDVLRQAVYGGVGLAGIHGGLGDAFRNVPEYQYMVGGQWVAHPGNDAVTYDVHILDQEHPITRGISDFSVTSEQYYMHIDPAIHTLATTQFGDTTMPVAWTKRYGFGKVFYHSLGHKPEIVRMQEVSKLTRRGMLWAASDKEASPWRE
ncbi:ThuA domain-containing protein [Alicyclobacillus dauci]|uniref:ThuA domain-containing protein n=1 Tax=Alicyclobacillus dauci TaxID=1475485 RepID=A0ABY6YXC5_9BACL|nr:ThuA domain-containing protein [Alicyclobacillus dauci]WAH35258.1 ThuA domain-containing protein [Alicyclobacillus dauci]